VQSQFETLKEPGADEHPVIVAVLWHITATLTRPLEGPGRC
jgi:gluconate kinase